MLNQRGLSTALILILVGGFTLALAVINHKPAYLANQIRSTDEMSEDELSESKIPDEVLTALNQSITENRAVLGIQADGLSYHIPILMYHYVEHVKDPGDKIRISLNTLPEVLDKQLDTLVKANYNFITASDLADILDGIKPAPPKPVILTFDDGYRDFYTDAFPILKKYGIKSVNYVVAGFLNKPNNLTVDQLKEISQSGLVEIGAHTVSHLALKGIGSKQLTAEVSSSRLQLEQVLGLSVTAFAYPYGSFDLNAIGAVKQAGFRTSVSTVAGSSASNSVRFFIYRLRPGARTGQSLIDLLEKN